MFENLSCPNVVVILLLVTFVSGVTWKAIEKSIRRDEKNATCVLNGVL